MAQSMSAKKKSPLKKRLWEQRELQLMVIPGIIFVFIFAYLPMYGIIMGFQHFRLGDFPGFSEWVGLRFFREFLTSREFPLVMRNTFVLAFYKLLFNFTLPIGFALLINEVRHSLFKRSIQTVSYLPHFISWVVVAGITFDFLSIDGGALNGILMWLNIIDRPIMFMGEARYFRAILVITELWKDMGWNSIIYIAAMASIDPGQYESASIDGANRLKKAWYITLPGIKPTITILLILAIGNLMNSGFEQILLLTNNLNNTMVASVSNVLDIFTFNTGIRHGRISYATAIGTFRSAISIVLLLSANFVAKRLNGESLF
ncbi:MAG: ABC transporter permease subunit [Defluviitaleaceae bacterium]|nr:ABC transporter permease subunit [Defluviitaleaceae bacterium]